MSIGFPLLHRTVVRIANCREAAVAKRRTKVITGVVNCYLEEAVIGRNGKAVADRVKLKFNSMSDQVANEQREL
ncbi:MAG TPA: hypothetical protein VEJ47_22850 [Candidatus Eremiobacteraceae bacterium]|nr:hypothetical protein [Candidatus Eremiobacteraceae bacterium]